jgi:hypothetical protein
MKEERKAKRLPYRHEIGEPLWQAEHCGEYFVIRAWRVFRESEEIFWFETVCPKCGEGFDRQVNLTSSGEQFGVENSAQRFAEIYDMLPNW